MLPQGKTSNQVDGDTSREEQLSANLVDSADEEVVLNATHISKESMVEAMTITSLKPSETKYQNVAHKTLGSFKTKNGRLTTYPSSFQAYKNTDRLLKRVRFASPSHRLFSTDSETNTEELLEKKTIIKKDAAFDTKI